MTNGTSELESIPQRVKRARTVAEQTLPRRVSLSAQFFMNPYEATKNMARAVFEETGRQAIESSMFAETMFWKPGLDSYKATEQLIPEIWEEVGQQAVENWRAAERLLWGPSRDLINEVAYRMWGVADRRTELTFDFWLAAEKYVASLWTVATTAVGRSVLDEETSGQFNDLLRWLPPERYMHSVRQMAYSIWEARGRPYWRALEDWVEAERNVRQRIAFGKTAEHERLKEHAAPGIFHMEVKMKDQLVAVINACKAKTHINVTPDIPVMDLITLRNLAEEDIIRIRSFQKVIHDELGVDIVVVGGGFGCSRITIAIQADIQLDNETAETMLKLLLSLDSFRKAAVEAGFPIAIHENTRVQLDTGNIEIGTDRLGLLVFISYAQADDTYRVALEKHLSSLKRQGMISLWHRRAITAGSEWSEQIDLHINMANIILLLITPDFLASDYCSGAEVKTALHRHDSNDARVIPIIVRAVDWVGSEFSRLQVLPKDKKPVTSWENQDEAWMEVAICIRTVVQDILKQKVARYGRQINKGRPMHPDRGATEISPFG